jgi:Xaa-Pro aminopeptidase
MHQLLRGFPPETFRRRRERAFALLGPDALVLPGGSIQYTSRDTEHRFRPDSEVFYLSGLEEPDVVVVLRGHADDQEKSERFVIFVRPRDAKAELWSGKRLGPDAARELYGADAAYPLSELEERLPGLLDGSRRVYYRMDQHPRTESLVRGAIRHARARGARTGTGPRGIIDPGEILDDMRLVKDAAEIQKLRRACEISELGMRAAAESMRAGVGEWELEAALEAAYRRNGAEGPGYPSIVASGANACVLHYTENNRQAGANDLVLIDAGASVDLYCGDITRTLPIGGCFTPEQRLIYDVVEKARADAVAEIRPGATVASVHDAATKTLVAGLIDLGVLEGDPAALIAEKKHEAFYPHRTSHWLGLDVHDPGDYARGGQDRALEPGMVLTVEPGLYFGEGAARFVGIGVRIEDDVLVTSDGHEVLTPGVPTGSADVERWVRETCGGNR